MVKAKKTKKKDRKVGTHGFAHVHASFNNTIVSMTDMDGGVIAWASPGKVGFKGSRKSTPYAAQMAAEDAGKKAQDYGLRTLSVFVKGPGSGREAAIRGLANIGYNVTLLRDITPIPHNGCRPKKKRRV